MKFRSHLLCIMAKWRNLVPLHKALSEVLSVFQLPNQIAYYEAFKIEGSRFHYLLKVLDMS